MAERDFHLVTWRSDDSSIVLQEASPGAWVGLTECLGRSAYLCDAVARNDVVIGVVGAGDIEMVIGQPGLRREVFSQISNGVEVVHELLEHRDAESLIVSVLQRRAPRGGAVEITQEELAAITGLSRETVNRNLARLATKGVIAVDRGRIVVRDRPG